MRCLLLFCRRASLPNTDACRYLDHFFLKQLAFCENNRKVEFLKISSPRAEDSANSKAQESRGQGLHKPVLEDVFEAKDILEDYITAFYIPPSTEQILPLKTFQRNF